MSCKCCSFTKDKHVADECLINKRTLNAFIQRYDFGAALVVESHTPYYRLDMEQTFITTCPRCGEKLKGAIT